MAAETSNVTGSATGIVTGISGRYATALFALAEERGQIDAVAADIGRLKSLLDESADLMRLVRSPLFRRDEQSKAMSAVMELAGLGDLLRRFVGTVAANGRLFALSAMIRDFQALLSRHRGEVVAKVVSATPLSERQMQALSDALRRTAGRAVIVEAEVDPDLIGGLKVRIGSRLVDATLKTRLQNLKIAMKGVA